MSSLLWKYYLEYDVDRFRRLLAAAASGPRPSPQKGSIGGVGITAAATGSPGSGIGLAAVASPKSTAKGKKSPALYGGGGGAGKSGPVLTKADVNSRDSSGLT